MAIAKVILNGETQMDVTQKTVTAGSMLSGTTALKNDGTDITGNIASKSSSDLTASGATVTAPAGYYASNASKSVASGSAGTPTATKGTVTNHSVSVTPSVTNTTGYITGGTKTGTAVTVSASELVSGTKTISASGTTDVTNYESVSVPSGSAKTPATTITANPTISVNSSGLITATVSKTQSVTPTVSAGYASSGTAGTITVSGSGTNQLTTQAAQTIHPSTTDQTIASGKYLTGAQTVKAVTTTNLTAKNIVQGVTVKVGDSTDDDCVASVTGTASGGGGSDEDFKAFIGRSTTDPTLPSDLTTIGAYAFYHYTNLALTSLPSGITSIDEHAFQDCTTLALTSLPNGITSIGNEAFRNCQKLTLTSLPSELTSIGTYAFQNCSRLALTSLPDGLTSIKNYAFLGCTDLALTSLHDDVWEIGTGAFEYCKGITSLSGNCRITTFGSAAFNGNWTNRMQLAHVSLPNMAVASLYTVFGSTTATNACQQLEDADIGNTSAIEANAFANCNKLQTLIIRKSNAICTLANTSAFTNTPIRGYNGLSGTIYVPSALISTYQTATNWSTIYGEGHVTFAAIEGSEYEL